jgi:hypothetical protein
MPEMSSAQKTEIVLKNPKLPFGSNTSVAELVLPPQGWKGGEQRGIIRDRCSGSRKVCYEQVNKTMQWLSQHRCSIISFVPTTYEVRSLGWVSPLPLWPCRTPISTIPCHISIFSFILLVMFFPLERYSLIDGHYDICINRNYFKITVTGRVEIVTARSRSKKAAWDHKTQFAIIKFIFLTNI